MQEENHHKWNIREDLYLQDDTYFDREIFSQQNRTRNNVKSIHVLEMYKASDLQSCHLNWNCHLNWA